MTALTVRLPDSVYQKVRELAERDNISMNQFIVAAVSEKMASVIALDYLKLEAAKGKRGEFDRYLNLEPNRPIA
jgi:predicted transcriptional regulator